MAGHLLLVGDNDHVVPPEHRAATSAALGTARVRHELVEYPDTEHGFLCNRRATYNPTAAGDAWRRIEALLHDELANLTAARLVVEAAWPGVLASCR